ncbi:consortin-like [Alosa alosa]|uniref:consortin-like n=1 Tax=Alosa alosa TaxID=278164 RepID=UPI0020153690|nr:consortin-like [Alosa alosa]XP_048086377.1 consortin-like [Alosa alosa]XP_048086378.1 consortin-like [Alosa alosa]
MPIRNEAVVEGNEAREIRARVIHEGGGDPDIYHAPKIKNNKSEKIDTSTVSKGGFGDTNIHHEPKVKVQKCEKIDAQIVADDSWLPLRLLCLVALGFGVVGTTIYCMVGDPKSPMCTAFFNNIKVYMAQVLNFSNVTSQGDEKL